MKHRVLKVHPSDNVLVALTDLLKGERIAFDGSVYQLQDNIKAKHKFAICDLAAGAEIIMYGVLVGKAQQSIASGSWINTTNVKHASGDFKTGERNTHWSVPDVSKYQGRTFNGYYRSDGSVGTANYWIVIPMVFCENRNLDILEQSLVNELGYGNNQSFRQQSKQLIEMYQAGSDVESILNADIQVDAAMKKSDRLFPNVDGIKFLSHELGCGGTRQIGRASCRERVSNCV